VHTHFSFAPSARLAMKSAVTVITVERSVHAALAAGPAQHLWINVSGPAAHGIWPLELLQAGKSRVAITSPEAHREGAKELPIVYGIFMTHRMGTAKGNETVAFICVQTLPPRRRSLGAGSHAASSQMVECKGGLLPQSRFTQVVRIICVQNPGLRK
jgi:hypothetical protein